MNRFFTLLFSASCLTAVGQVPDYVPTDGLLAWCPLDGSVMDNSGYYQNPFQQGGQYIENRFTEIGKALYFNGIDDFASLDGAFDGDVFSIALWVHIESETKGSMVHIGNNGFTDLQSLELEGCDGFGIGVGSNTTYLSTGTNLLGHFPCVNWNPQSVDVLLGVWQHVVVTFDGTALKSYRNGELMSEADVSPFFDPTPSLYLGTLGPISNANFEGILDDIGAWNRVLSSEEIAALFNAPGPLEGCSDEAACNYDLEVVVDDGSCFYADDCGECGGDGTSGCTDSYACNFDAEAACDDGSCDYSCCPGPGCCSVGHYWDWEIGKCFDINPADINLDGCVQLNDLLDLLSAYGDCGAEESAWQCGDPLEYQGYEYATVQIGEQCWFAENLRAENYRNGDPIPDNLTNSEWVSTSQGARGIYVDSESGIVSHTYNGYAVQDERGVCPESWHVPSDLEWMELELYIGLDESEGEVLGLRGNHGALLKSSASEVPSWDGTNELGFNGLPSWGRGGGNGTFGGGTKFKGWSSTDAPSGDIWLRNLLDSNSGVERDNDNPHNGCNVRCLKNAE